MTSSSGWRLMLSSRTSPDATLSARSRTDAAFEPERPAGGDLEEGVRMDGLGLTVPEAVRVVGRRTAQNVNADAVARSGATDPVPALVGWQQERDVTLAPVMAARLLQRRRGPGVGQAP